MKKSLIIAATVGVIAGLSGYCFQKKKYSKLLEVYRGVADKNLDIFLLFDQWLEKKQEGIRLSSYFEKYGYKNIAIYGMGIEIRLHVDFITISCPCHHLGTQTENPVQTDVP